MPTVSICIPTYNGESFLDQCLQSVQMQTFEDYELIIVDDCSTDSTYEIVQHHANLDSRIKYFRNTTNLGLVANWNRCIDLAEGDWIKFVFQDDFLAPNCIDAMLAAARSGDAFIACSRSFEFEPDTPPAIREFYLRNKAAVDGLYSSRGGLPANEYADVAITRVGWNLVGEPTVTLIHRSIFERFGKFDERLIMSCDLEYWTRIAIHTGIRFLSEELASFRVHGKATSATNRRERQYQMHVLDNLAIWHDVATAPAYQPLREAASRMKPPLELADVLAKKAHSARIVAEYFDRHDNSKQVLFTDQWERFVKEYPRLRVGGISHLYWCARNLADFRKARTQIALP